MCIDKLRCSCSIHPFNTIMSLLHIPAGSAEAGAASVTCVDTSFTSASACTGSPGPDRHRAARGGQGKRRWAVLRSAGLAGAVQVRPQIHVLQVAFY